MRQSKYIAVLVCLAYSISGCSTIDINEETQASISGETAIAIQTVTDTEATTVIEETTEEVPTEQIWTYSNFDGIDLSGDSFTFSQRKKIQGEAAANDFIDSFVSQYNGNSPVCLFEAGEYSVYEYLADGGTIFVYIDNLGLDPAYTVQSNSETDESAGDSEQLDTDEANIETSDSISDETTETTAPDYSDAARIVECYYIDYAKINTLGNIPQSCEDSCWDRMSMTSSIENIIDKWNVEAPADYVPEIVNNYTMIDYNVTASDDGATASSGKMFLDNMGRPVFVRYYLTNGNSSEMFFYNDNGDLAASLKFSGMPYKDMGDYDEGLIMTAYFFSIDKPEPGCFAGR